jgi:CubicO group peptidase (beta-lactamase class C family)
MVQRAIASVCLLALLVAAPFVPAQTPDSLDTRVEAAVTQTMREQKIPGLAIGIVRDGRLVYARGFGVMEMGKPDRPITPQTLFHMASITKPFVATALMQLVEQGKVNLDDPVVKYLPYFTIDDPRCKAITVRQMATHTSGMPDVQDYLWNKPEYDEGALERYVRSLGDKKLRFAPGTEFRYSNMAFEVLGDVVAKASGQNFDDYVDEHILKPAGMKSSTLLFKKADPAKLAAGYTLKNDEVVPIAHYPYNRAHTPSSNLHSNVEDMARWIAVNLNRGELDKQRILKRDSYDVLWKHAFAVPQRNWHVGLSWFLAPVGDDELVMHNGGDDGFTTHLSFVPATRSGIVLMANCDHLSSIKSIFAAAMGREAPWAK